MQRSAAPLRRISRRAPRQVALGRGGGAALDAWSLGCVLAELALQRPLFPAHAPSQLLAQACIEGSPVVALHAA
jgi:serine/threonine protein kinase